MLHSSLLFRESCEKLALLVPPGLTSFVENKGVLFRSALHQDPASALRCLCSPVCVCSSCVDNPLADILENSLLLVCHLTSSVWCVTFN
mmetsp:Transcript_86549/g.135470  ORF Transcript_86549/g.135470 Transcript_86549/m.135470 type:complete len:89 (-) Transcript_86549:318-584(-)